MSEVKIRLINAEARHAENESFEIPPEYARNNLAVGDFAKIGIEGNGRGERFWVQVTNEIMDGLYRGIATNDLVIFSPTAGYPFTFGPEHIIAVRAKISGNL